MKLSKRLSNDVNLSINVTFSDDNSYVIICFVTDSIKNGVVQLILICFSELYNILTLLICYVANMFDFSFVFLKL